MKILVWQISVLILTIILLSNTFQSKLENDVIPNIWIQKYNDEIEIKYVFKDINNCKILESIVITEPNKGNSNGLIFTNQIYFDSIGKIRKIFLVNQVNLIHDVNRSYFSYEEDACYFEKNKISDVKISSNFQTLLRLTKYNNLLCQINGDLVFPIGNYDKLNPTINCNAIGKPVSLKLKVEDFQDSLRNGLFNKD